MMTTGRKRKAMPSRRYCFTSAAISSLKVCHSPSLLVKNPGLGLEVSKWRPVSGSCEQQSSDSISMMVEFGGGCGRHQWAISRRGERLMERWAPPSRDSRRKKRTYVRCITKAANELRVRSELVGAHARRLFGASLSVHRGLFRPR